MQKLLTPLSLRVLRKSKEAPDEIRWIYDIQMQQVMNKAIQDAEKVLEENERTHYLDVFDLRAKKIVVKRYFQGEFVIDF